MSSPEKLVPLPKTSSPINSAGSPITLQYVRDITAAGLASLFVSPFIAIVDRSIIENANGKLDLVSGLKQGFKHFSTRPHQFIRSKQFGLIYGLYFATYATANTIDTTYNYWNSDPQWPKFVGTTAVNMTLCIAKDRAFTRMFGIVAPRPLPIPSYALFAVRDSLTVAASFNAPSITSKELQTYGYSRETADVIAQLFCPAIIQFASTPLHLLGLDLYNRPDATSGKRLTLIGREYLKSVFARIGRIGPAFGIGGVGNLYFRRVLGDCLPNKKLAVAD
ncbi:uncharacterized protein VTP21DRAFT_8200 [Calcarisporiella thermophila]|uniref:uncharacterized protein n=1 Tax=Calcarisporiella thermophila TaxID=911321 RepID=UPI003743B817